MEIMRNIKLTGSEGRPFLLDTYPPAGGPARGTVIFAHGFKGFKDWGHWELIAGEFARYGYLFVKFNFSHNGTTTDQPQDFADLEAFGRNNYTRELADIDRVLDWLHSDETGFSPAVLRRDHVALIGHSRGGGLSVIAAERDERIHALITWAAVSSLAYAWQDPELVRNWQREGVHFIENARTGQQMPLYYQLYEDYSANERLLDVERAARNLHKPWLIVHGTDDPSVPVAAARQLKSYNDGALLHLIEGGDHVFSGRHPFQGRELPAHARELVDTSVAFLNRQWQL